MQTRTCKVETRGAYGVGKSSLVTRACRDTFKEDIEHTIGASFLCKTIRVDGIQFKFEIWDRFRSLDPPFHRSCDASIIVYDITERDTFEMAKNEVIEKQRYGDPNIVIILVGNKCDLDSKRVIDKEEAQKYAEEKEIMFFESSAKTNVNIEELFVTIASKVPPKHGTNRSFQLAPEPAPPPQQSGCW